MGKRIAGNRFLEICFHLGMKGSIPRYPDLLNEQIHYEDVSRQAALLKR